MSEIGGRAGCVQLRPTRQEDQERRHVHLPRLYARFTNSPQLGIDMAVPIW